MSKRSSNTLPKKVKDLEVSMEDQVKQFRQLYSEFRTYSRLVSRIERLLLYLNVSGLGGGGGAGPAVIAGHKELPEPMYRWIPKFPYAEEIPQTGVQTGIQTGLIPSILLVLIPIIFQIAKAIAQGQDEQRELKRNQELDKRLSDERKKLFKDIDDKIKRDTINNYKMVVP